MKLERTRSCITDTKCYSFFHLLFQCICIYLHITFYSLFYYRMAKTNELLSAVENKSALVVNSVKVEDLSDWATLVIQFTSDGDERTKRMPLTEDGLKARKDIEKLLADERFDPNFIWDMIKPGNKSELSWMFVWLVRDKAKEAKEKVSSLANDFAWLRLNANPIDAI